MKLKPPSVSLLENLPLGDSLKKDDNLLKAARMYFFLKATYDEEGFVCGNNCFKLDLKTKRGYDFKKKELDLEENNIHQFKKTDWFIYLNINSVTSHKNLTNWIKNESQEKNKRDKQQSIKIDNMSELLKLTIDNILFNSNLAEKEIFLKEFQQRYGQIDLERIEKSFFKDGEPMYPFRNKSQDVNITTIEKKKIDGLIRAYGNDFQSLVKQGWFLYTQEKDKKDGKYELQQEFSNFIQQTFLVNDSKSINTAENNGDVDGEFASDGQFANFIQKFHNIEESRLIVTSEYVIKSEDKKILGKLEKNWFGVDNQKIEPFEVPQPILLDCQKFESPKIVYPVGFVYIQRAPYLYFIYQQDENRINWGAVRSDRITDVKILNWNDNNIPSLLKQQEEESLPNCYDILDYFEYDKALGYAFWKTKSWAILRFNREHYEKYIKGTSRESYLTNLEKPPFDSLQSLIEKESKKLNREVEDNLDSASYKHQKIKLKDEQLADLKIVEKNLLKSRSSKDYVFCLAKYYEGDSYVLQRLLAWGKQVKVLFPQKLKTEISEEIKATLQQYSD